MSAEASPVTSVVIPVYNRARLLERAIRSVLEQDSPVEVVVVDDGSSDGSVDVANALAADAPIQVIRQPNKGSSAARATGARAAKGRWLLFLDSDDYLLPGALRVLLDLAERHPGAEFVFGEVVFEQLEAPGQLSPAPQLPWGGARAIARHILLHSSCFNCRFLVRREAYYVVGGYDAGVPVGAPELMLFVPLFLRYPFARTRTPVAVVSHGAGYRLSEDLAGVARGWRQVLDRLGSRQDTAQFVDSIRTEIQGGIAAYLALQHYARGEFGLAREHAFRSLLKNPRGVLQRGPKNPLSCLVKSLAKGAGGFS